MFNTLVLTSQTILNLSVIPHRYISIMGVMLFLTLFVQIVTGIFISFSAVNDFALLPISRSTEDMYDLYTDDFFWLHQRGVDLIFTFLFIHLLRKMNIMTANYLQLSAWKSGSLMFLLIHGIIFFGLVLCCTHLSDITLKIAANIVQTLTLKYGQLGYWLFTDHTLNTDTLIRLMYLHYTLPFILLFFIIIHLLDMHYGYKDSFTNNNILVNYSWFGLVFKNELFYFLSTLAFLNYINNDLHTFNEPLSFELFMWGDVGLIVDVRFLGVAPHWYFRAYMGWLIFCPHHYIGIFGLIYFFLSIYFVINISYKQTNFYLNNPLNFLNDKNLLQQNLWIFFLLNLLYTGSYLPCGKYFTELEGNIASSVAYLYVLFNMGYNTDYKLNSFLTKNNLKLINKWDNLIIFENTQFDLKSEIKLKGLLGINLCFGYC